MEGVLLKWTNYIMGWQHRYFILKDGILSYYQSRDDINNSCKGSVKVSACDIIVNSNIPTLLDIIVPNEAYIYVKASSQQERQLWLVALGSAKACFKQATYGPDITDGISSSKIEDFNSKKSELNVYRDLLMQQVFSIKKSVSRDGGVSRMDIETLKDSAKMLTTTCDAFIKTLDECFALIECNLFQPTIDYAYCQNKMADGINKMADNSYQNSFKTYCQQRSLYKPMDRSVVHDSSLQTGIIRTQEGHHVIRSKSKPLKVKSYLTFNSSTKPFTDSIMTNASIYNDLLSLMTSPLITASNNLSDVPTNKPPLNNSQIIISDKKPSITKIDSTKKSSLTVSDNNANLKTSHKSSKIHNSTSNSTNNSTHVSTHNSFHDSTRESIISPSITTRHSVNPLNSPSFITSVFSSTLNNSSKNKVASISSSNSSDIDMIDTNGTYQKIITSQGNETSSSINPEELPRGIDYFIPRDIKYGTSKDSNIDYIATVSNDSFRNSATFKNDSSSITHHSVFFPNDISSAISFSSDVTRSSIDFTSSKSLTTSNNKVYLPIHQSLLTPNTTFNLDSNLQIAYSTVTTNTAINDSIFTERINVGTEEKTDRIKRNRERFKNNIGTAAPAARGMPTNSKEDDSIRNNDLNGTRISMKNNNRLYRNKIGMKKSQYDKEMLNKKMSSIEELELVAEDERIATYFSELTHKFSDIKLTENYETPTVEFLKACHLFAGIFKKLDFQWFVPTKDDFIGNLKKLNQKFSSKPFEFTTLEKMVTSEVELEQASNSLSATHALLWLNRFLSFVSQSIELLTEEIFIEMDTEKNGACITTIADLDSSWGNNRLAKMAKIAYDITLKPHHGAVLESSFLMPFSRGDLSLKSLLDRLSVGTDSVQQPIYLKCLIVDAVEFNCGLKKVVNNIETFLRQNRLDFKLEV